MPLCGTLNLSNDIQCHTVLSVVNAPGITIPTRNWQLFGNLVFGKTYHYCWQGFLKVLGDPIRVP